MNITECYGLPFVNIAIEFRGKMLSLEKVLIDTGSASTLLNADIVGEIDMIPEKDDVVDTIRGVGGVEYVYTKYVDAVIIGEAVVKDFQVEIGSMDYGMDIHGIIGFNFLKRVGAQIDAAALKIKVC